MTGRGSARGTARAAAPVSRLSVTLTMGSLFAGVGGFELGAQIAGGIETIWQAERDPFCAQILGLRYPGVRLLNDVQHVDGATPRPHLLAAGFPCQPSSNAGLGHGADDPRWLWPHTARVVSTLEPPLVLVENVTGLLQRGMQDVVFDLARLGYDAQWDIVPAATVGAQHLRERVIVVAYHAGSTRARIFRQPDRQPFPGREPSPRSVSPLPREGVKRSFALGNAVVPQTVAAVIAMLRTARGELQLDKPLDRLPARVPAAGALVRGRVYELERACVSSRKQRWPTPKATVSGPDYARAARPKSGGDDLATAVSRTDGSGKPSPAWLEWLMGFPDGWTDTGCAADAGELLRTIPRAA